MVQSWIAEMKLSKNKQRFVFVPFKKVGNKKWSKLCKAFTNHLCFVTCAKNVQYVNTSVDTVLCMCLDDFC